jgi:hypothetical protein
MYEYEPVGVLAFLARGDTHLPEDGVKAALAAGNFASVEDAKANVREIVANPEHAGWEDAFHPGQDSTTNEKAKFKQEVEQARADGFVNFYEVNVDGYSIVLSTKVPLKLPEWNSPIDDVDQFADVLFGSDVGESEPSSLARRLIG